jgi:VanZ family protein
VLLLVLVIGTQIPGAWRNGLEQSLHAPFPLSKLAHVLLFASMACLARVPPLMWPLRRIVLAALALGLATEALQLLAIERHPGLDDVAIDLAGTALGLTLAAWSRWRLRRVSA